tara:strand:+ start:4808 stop:5134 length:327 start_codon:yes stop_codon:yes gene_type:complete
MNLPPQNINALLLDQSPGSPDAYQIQQAMQQQAKRDEVDAGMAGTQKIAAIMDMAKQQSAGEATPENKANALLLNTMAGIQMNAGGGQAKMALAQEDGNAILRRLYGG